MKSIVENSTLLFSGVFSGAIGILLSESYPLLPSKSEIVYVLLMWSATTAAVIMVKVGKIGLISILPFSMVVLGNYYYVNPALSLILGPVLPIMPLVLIPAIYLAKKRERVHLEFGLRATAISFTGVCIVFDSWIYMHI